MFRAPCAHRQEVKLYYTASGIIILKQESGLKLLKKKIKITKMYKYDHIVVKFMCEFFGCDYCVLLTINIHT